MAGRAVGILFRIVTIVCALVTLLTAVPYALLQGEDLPTQREWIVFVAALGLVGISSFVIGVLPRARIASLLNKQPDDLRLFSALLKRIGLFAAVFYGVAVIEFYAPRTWNLNPRIMFALCPMSLVRMSIDPSPVVIFLILAPMNAALYGSLGLTSRFAWSAFRRQH